jgi:hypothetical protein
LTALGVMAVMSKSSRIYTIDVDGKAVVCFPADSWLEARELAREKWLRADLAARRSAGEPLGRQTSKLRPRFATPEEIIMFERHRAVLGRQPDDLELVYLVELDNDGLQ